MIGHFSRPTTRDIEWNIPEFWLNTSLSTSTVQSDKFQFEGYLYQLKVTAMHGYILVILVKQGLYDLIGRISGKPCKFSAGLKTGDRAIGMSGSNSKVLSEICEVCFWVSIDEVFLQFPNLFDLTVTLKGEPLIVRQGTSQVMINESIAGGIKKEPSEEHKESEKLILPKPKNLANLTNSLKQLLESETNTDVVLKVKGKDFKAHQNILISRSPVLMSTFEHDMEEKRTGVVKIDDCDPESFYDFLLFLYTGHIAKLVSSHHTIELYKTAHKYDVPDLREECVEYLRDNLTVENVCDVMKLALQYDEDQLNEVAKEFFLNNSSAVAETSQFGDFLISNTKAAQKLIAHIRR